MLHNGYLYCLTFTYIANHPHKYLKEGPRLVQCLPLQLSTSRVTQNILHDGGIPCHPQWTRLLTQQRLAFPNLGSPDHRRVPVGQACSWPHPRLADSESPESLGICFETSPQCIWWFRNCEKHEMNEIVRTIALSSKMPKESWGLSWATQVLSGNLKSRRSEV